MKFEKLYNALSEGVLDDIGVTTIKFKNIQDAIKAKRILDKEKPDVEISWMNNTKNSTRVGGDTVELAGSRENVKNAEKLLSKFNSTLIMREDDDQEGVQPDEKTFDITDVVKQAKELIKGSDKTEAISYLRTKMNYYLMPKTKDTTIANKLKSAIKTMGGEVDKKLDASPNKPSKPEEKVKPNDFKAELKDSILKMKKKMDTPEIVSQLKQKLAYYGNDRGGKKDMGAISAIKTAIKRLGGIL